METSQLSNALLTKAAREFGTPLYAYDEQVIERQYERLKQALKRVQHRICFAVKANSNLSILEKFIRLGAGFDIVSGGELHRVLRAGADAKDVVFAGVGKTPQEIKYAIASGIGCFNVESAAELELIQSIAASMSACAPVAFRVNPDISVDTHPYLATGLKESKFGIPLNNVMSLWERVANRREISVIGVDCHIGSNIVELDAYRAAFQEVVRIADELAARGAPIQHVDFGGGLGISYSGKYEAVDVEGYGRCVQDALGDRPYTVLIEPGKFLIAEAGVLLTSVLYEKRNEENRFVIVDAGMNDLMRPALYEAYHRIEPLSVDTGEPSPATIAGPVCESGCVFGTARPLPPVKHGDLLVIRDAGAYGFSMASNYNTRSRPAEILYSDKEYRLIRARESVEDLMRHERLDREGSKVSSILR